MNNLKDEAVENFQCEEGSLIMPPQDIIAFNELRSCSDIYRMYAKKQLEIQPDFQRNEVWTNQAKTRFVDSIMKGLPIPSMCISLDIKTQKRLVIDGLQRISTIVHFLNEEDDWRMSKCDDVYEEISGQKTSYVKDTHPDLFDRFENATIPITVIRCDYSNSNHMEYLFNIFHRLNSGGTKLTNQEIRNCIYQGNFNKLLKETAKSEEWHAIRDFKDNNRYKEEEIILRFYALYFNFDNYNGNMTSFLNNYMSSNRVLSDSDISKFKDLLAGTIAIAKEIESLSNSGINVLLSTLIGIAKNKNKNKLAGKDKDVIVQLYNKLLQEEEFSEQNLQDGLSSTSKVKNRINKSIEIFGSND